jgi:hypothetical protein
MSKQWDGFDQEWLKERLAKNVHEQGEAKIQEQMERIQKEQLQICIAKGIHAKNEEELHMAVVEYIRLAYPDRFQWVHSDMSGFRVGIKARVKLGTLKHSRGFPDLVIYDHGLYLAAAGPPLPRIGLALELKHQDCKPKPILKDGSMSTDIHIQEQHAWLQQFRKLGFSAYFVLGFEQAKAKIDAYYTSGLHPDPEQPGPGSLVK